MTVEAYLFNIKKNKMTKQEYKQKVKELMEARNSIRIQLGQLEEDYLLENMIFKAGDKVELIFENGDKEIVFIRSCNVHSDGEIFYTFYKAKKDGSMSQIRFHYYGYNKYEIRKLESCQPEQNEESK